MKRRREKYLKKQKHLVIYTILLILIVILLLGLLLDKHLYDLQREERISKIEDYRNFHLSYQEQNRCKLEEKFQIEDTTIYYDCLEEVYIKYGSTLTTLKDVMESGYLTVKDILSQTKEGEDGIYYHSATKDAMGYQIKLIENEESSKVIISKYLQ